MSKAKKPAAKKKDAGSAENGGELSAEEKAKLFMLTCQSLQVQLGEELLCTLIWLSWLSRKLKLCYYSFIYYHSGALGGSK